MRSIWIGLALLAALAGCSGGASPFDPFSDSSAIEDAKRAVKEKLKDPSSASFSGIYIVRRAPAATGASKVYLCGHVNARNSYGGFAGNTRFFVSRHENRDLGITETRWAEIEDQHDRRVAFRASSEDRSAGRLATEFEQTYWNLYCAADGRPKTYSARSE